MNLRRALLLAGLGRDGRDLTRCGSNSSSPTATATPPTVILPSPSPVPTPTGPTGLPAGMVCSSPTPAAPATG